MGYMNKIERIQKMIDTIEKEQKINVIDYSFIISMNYVCEFISGKKFIIEKTSKTDCANRNKIWIKIDFGFNEEQDYESIFIGICETDCSELLEFIVNNKTHNIKLPLSKKGYDNWLDIIDDCAFAMSKVLSNFTEKPVTKNTSFVPTGYVPVENISTNEFIIVNSNNNLIRFPLILITSNSCFKHLPNEERTEWDPLPTK